jgi:hypothetical protein
MKLFKKLKAYNQEETDGAVFGFGVIQAMNYDSERRGHLFLFSFRKIIKKLFIPL